MKIQIICENCSTIAELLPRSKDAEVGIRTVNQTFFAGVSWKNEVIENFQEEFIDKLGKAISNEERKEILEDGISRNTLAETVDFELSFTCRGCGDRITLNDFQLIDFIGF